jgi:lipopolysaccharide export system ATP-binding protein
MTNDRDNNSPFGSDWLRQPANDAAPLPPQAPAAQPPAHDVMAVDTPMNEIPAWPEPLDTYVPELPVAEATVYAEPVAEAVVLPLPPKEPAQPKKPVLVHKNSGLSVEKLGKQYAKRPVVRNVSISLQRGEAVGLLGPNGAGKTTCFYMITGLVTPDYGSIYLDGTEITKLPMYRRARLGIGYLPQEASIFRGLTVEQNIMAVLEVSEQSPEKRRAMCEELLAEFSITHLRNSPAVALSGGERRRAEIARALAGRPSFILLDEPLAGIDPIAISDVRDLVKHLKNRGIGVLITDHNVRETLDVIDRAYIIHDGTVLMEGSPSDIVNNHEVRRVYLGEKFSL